MKSVFNEKSSLLQTSPQHSYTEENSVNTPNFDDDFDTVIRSLQSLKATTQKVLVSWMLSYTIYMAMCIQHDRFTVLSELLICSISMIGCVYGIYTIIFLWLRLCGNLKLVTRENLTYIRSQGIRVSDIMPYFIEYDSLPLLRFLLFGCWAIGSILSLILLSQILLVFWFFYGVIGMWDALIPIILVLVTILLYMYLIKTFSLVSCINMTVLFLDLVSLTSN